MNEIIPLEVIRQKIFLIRGQKVMLDTDLAQLYEVATKVFNQAVKRNIKRFPSDFMFQLRTDEYEALRSQIVTLKPGRGQHRKYLPFVFTEQGVAMLATVLNSERAIQVNIEIMRAFVSLRNMFASNAAFSRKIKSLEKKYDAQFRVVFEAIRTLMSLPEKKRQKIGFMRKDAETD